MHPGTTRRVLLISSPRSGFTCVEPSLDRMRDFLERNHFTDLVSVRGQEATRAAIIAGFTALIETTRPGDIVVVYYAGHGSLFVDRGAPNHTIHPLIEPMDIADSDASHFNGLLGAELRLFIRALAALSDNVTAIFDCCHAAGMLADDSDSDDAIAIKVLAQKVGTRIAERRAAPVTRSATRPATPAGVVRLVASCASERAYARPYTNTLLFTDTLITVLDEQAPTYPQSWSQVLRDVRERVQEVMPEQRPGVEGLTARRPFSTDTIDTPVDHFHVLRRADHLRLAAGTTAGIRPGDRFELLAYAGDATPLAQARVDRLSPFTATLALSRGAPPLPNALFARRLRTAHTFHAHLRAADINLLTDLQARLTASGLHLQPAILDPTTPPDHVDLHDLTHVARLPLADDTLDFLRTTLRRIERWAGLRAHLETPALGPLTGCYSLALELRRGAFHTPLVAGSTLTAGDTLHLRIDNPGRLGALHVHVYRARADRIVEPWQDIDGGAAVLALASLELELRPLPIPNLPTPQSEHLLIMIGDGPFDGEALTTPSADRPPAHRGPGEATRLELFSLPYTLAIPPVSAAQG